jgi:hypothetical protein
MQDDTPTTDVEPLRATIQLDIGDLPDETNPDRYVERLGDELRLALEDAGRTVPRVDTWTGPIHASLHTDCPDCEEHLEIDRPHLDEQNGALANARCTDDDCGWSGDAEYCLVDLAEYDDEDRAHSLVRAGRVTPSYEEY